MFAVSSTAMSHKEIFGEILVGVLPYLTAHEDRWYRDRHLHNKHGRRDNPMTPYAGCPCCAAKTSFDGNGCTLCLAAWKLSLVSVTFKTKVRAYGSKLRAWWWVWTPEYRAAKKAWRKGGKGKGKGYKPQ